jgi:hypothetical protein
MGSWQSEHPGVSLSVVDAGWEIRVPRESTAGTVISARARRVPAFVDKSAPPTLMTKTLTKYVLPRKHHPRRARS